MPEAFTQYPTFAFLAQIVSSAKDVVTTATHAVTGRVSGAKDTVSDTISTVVDRTRGAVQGGMERTRAMVSGGVSTVLESRVAQLVSSSVDSALSTSESLVEHYLPGTEDELGEWAWSSGQEVEVYLLPETEVFFSSLMSISIWCWQMFLTYFDYSGRWQLLLMFILISHLIFRIFFIALNTKYNHLDHCI